MLSLLHPHHSRLHLLLASSATWKPRRSAITFRTAPKALPGPRASFQRKSLNYLVSCTDNRRKYRNNRKTRRKKVEQMKNYNPLLCFISLTRYQIHAQTMEHKLLHWHLWKVEELRISGSSFIHMNQDPVWYSPLHDKVSLLFKWLF